jgi:hypothetical protein
MGTRHWLPSISRFGKTARIFSSATHGEPVFSNGRSARRLENEMRRTAAEFCDAEEEQGGLCRRDAAGRTGLGAPCRHGAVDRMGSWSGLPDWLHRRDRRHRARGSLGALSQLCDFRKEIRRGSLRGRAFTDLPAELGRAGFEVVGESLEIMRRAHRLMSREASCLPRPERMTAHSVFRDSRDARGGENAAAG